MNGTVPRRRRKVPFPRFPRTERKSSSARPTKHRFRLRPSFHLFMRRGNGRRSTRTIPLRTERHANASSDPRIENTHVRPFSSVPRKKRKRKSSFVRTIRTPRRVRKHVGREASTKTSEMERWIRMLRSRAAFECDTRGNLPFSRIDPRRDSSNATVRARRFGREGDRHEGDPIASIAKRDPSRVGIRWVRRSGLLSKSRSDPLVTCRGIDTFPSIGRESKTFPKTTRGSNDPRRGSLPWSSLSRGPPEHEPKRGWGAIFVLDEVRLHPWDRSSRSPFLPFPSDRIRRAGVHLHR